MEAELLAKSQGIEAPLKRVAASEIIERATNGHILLKDTSDHNRILACIFLYKYDQHYQ